MDISEKMKNDWDRRAGIDPMYWVEAEAWQDEKAYVRSAKEDTKSLLSGVEQFVSEKSCVLDIGCGMGRMIGVLSDHVGQIHGVDVSGKMVEEGKKRVSAKNNVYIHETDGTDLSLFEDNMFDFVYSFATLPHIPKELAYDYFREISRVLKRGSVLKVQLWIGKPNNPHPFDTLTPRVISNEEFICLYEENGFELLEIVSQDYIDPILQLKPVWCTFQNKKEAYAPFSKYGSNLTDNDSDDDSAKIESDLLVYYGNVVMGKGRYEKAKEAFVTALHLNPKSKEAYNCLTVLLIDEGNVTEAVQCLEAAVNEIPDYTEGKRYLQTLYTYNKIGRKGKMEVSNSL